MTCYKNGESLNCGPLMLLYRKGCPEFCPSLNKIPKNYTEIVGAFKGGVII